MDKLMKRVSILIIIFILAGGTFWYLNQEQAAEAIYVTMEDATLPIITMEVDGNLFNNLHGYVNNMDLVFMRDTITPLPQDRRLKVYIQELEEPITKLYYEIRSLDGSQLIEKTEISPEETEGKMYAVLPIQNLIAKDTEYSLTLVLSTQNHPSIYYYTRILLTDSTLAQEMIAFAKDFSSKTFDSAQAQELATYLESNKLADNSSLGIVNIQSSFHQITWGGLTVSRSGEPLVSITELGNGISTIKLGYQVTISDENGSGEVFDITEAFGLKWTLQRFYLMSYERTMNQIFEASEDNISGKKIQLGISHSSNFEVTASEDGKLTAFVSDKALWSYNLTDNEATQIFTFRDGTEDLRAYYDQYDIKVISIDNEGNTLFIVFGYMNRGKHEGEVGISFYQYLAKDNNLEEQFYIPADKSYQLLSQDIGKLSYVNENQMCYFMFGNSVYAIDLTGREYIVVVENIENSNIMVSDDSKRIAWVQPNVLSGKSEISIMNLDEGTKQTITAESDETLKVLGFVDEDFIYGIARNSDIDRGDGRIPLYAVEIIGDNQVVQSSYKKDGIYVTGVTVQESRIRLERASFSESNNLEPIAEDTLIRNRELGINSKLMVSKEVSATKKAVYYISLKDNVSTTKAFKIIAPQKILMPEEDNKIYIKGNNLGVQSYYAYSYGRLQGIYSEVTEAIQAVYEDMGTVVTSKQDILWWRSRKAVSKTLNVEGKITYSAEKSAMEMFKDAYPDKVIIDAVGCTLNQVLAFVSDGRPVVAIGASKEVFVLTGYDQYNVILLNLATGTTSKMGLNDGGSYFSMTGNQFFTYME